MQLLARRCRLCYNRLSKVKGILMSKRTQKTLSGMSFRDLILQPQLADEAVAACLASVNLHDWRDADRRLQHIAGEPPDRLAFADIVDDFLPALRDCADPDMALNYFGRFVDSLGSRSNLFHYLAQDPRTLETLTRLFAGSQFLTEILLRNPEYFDVLMAWEELARPKEREQFRQELVSAMKPFHSPTSQLNAARRFQRLELLRIGACDLLRLMDWETVTAQLSHLADALVEASSTALVTAHLIVFALGKLGGEELNYSSDIDLLFLCEDEAAQETAQRQAEELLEALTQATEEGFLYRVDMRLRPWGRVGPLVPTVSSYRHYLQTHAALWEKQALIKARPMAGNLPAGEALLRDIAPLIYDDTPMERLRRDVRGMKQKIERELSKRGSGDGHVKSGQGGIRDVEFIAQFLQLAHGREQPALRHHHTLTSLRRLAEGGLLSAEERQTLGDAYGFLRTVEHRLQMMHYRQVHTLPTQPRELDKLARRMGFADDVEFMNTYRRHTAAVRAIFERTFAKA
jgi:glutamate-ammonia-ligase adenylyltransferase